MGYSPQGHRESDMTEHTCTWLLFNAVLVSAVCEVSQLSYISSLLNLPPTPHPPFHPPRSPQNTKLSSLCYTAGSHQLYVLHISVYMSVPTFQFISLPLSPTLPYPHMEIGSLQRESSSDEVIRVGPHPIGLMS